MEAKHTPGPWQFVKDEVKIHGCLKDIFEIGNNTDDLHPYWVAYVQSRGCAETEANAKLIAAAPEMLEALQYYFNNDLTDHAKDLPAWEEKAKAAIKKATE